jgi:hypothetical protein
MPAADARMTIKKIAARMGKTLNGARLSPLSLFCNELVVVGFAADNTSDSSRH